MGGSSHKNRNVGILCCCLVLTACLPAVPSLPLSSEPPSLTETPTLTLTSTPLWFPPTATFTPFPTDEMTPTPDQRPALGEIILSDDFSTGEGWSLGRTNAASLAIGLDELTIAIAAPRAYAYSLRPQPLLSDFYAEITASPMLCRGADEYGLLFRFASPTDFYRFGVSCEGQVSLDRVLKGKVSSPQPWISSGAVLPGAPNTARLGVWVVGKEMRFFANDLYLFTVNDSTILAGALGVFARAAGDLAVTVNFSQLIVREVER